MKGKHCHLFNVKLNFLLEVYLICYMLNNSEFYITLALFEGLITYSSVTEWLGCAICGIFIGCLKLSLAAELSFRHLNPLTPEFSI